MISLFKFIRAVLLLSVSTTAFAATVEVRFLATEGSETSLFVFEGSGQYGKLDLQAYTRSAVQTVTLDADGRVALFREQPVGEGAEYVLQASATVPEGATELLAVYANPNKTPQLHLYDDSVDRFPLQSVRLINTTPVDVYSKVGDSTVQIAPFSCEILPIAYKSKRPVVKVLTVYKDGAGEWVPFYNKPTLLLPSMRLTGIAAVTRGGMADAMGVSEEAMRDGPTQAQADFFIYTESARDLSR